jgi:hypothetical protein
MSEKEPDDRPNKYTQERKRAAYERAVNPGTFLTSSTVALVWTYLDLARTGKAFGRLRRLINELQHRLRRSVNRVVYRAALKLRPPSPGNLMHRFVDRLYVEEGVEGIQSVVASRTRLTNGLGPREREPGSGGLALVFIPRGHCYGNALQQYLTVAVLRRLGYRVCFVICRRQTGRAPSSARPVCFLTYCRAPFSLEQAVGVGFRSPRRGGG